MPEKEMVILRDGQQEASALLSHKHTGTDFPKISIKDFSGFIEIVSSVPTHTPRSMYDQIKIYISGTQTSLYVYESTNKVWLHSNLK